MRLRRVFMLLAVLLLVGCATPTLEVQVVRETSIVQETVIVTQEPLPTHTPYPTYTPLPTYTLFPTWTVLPTATPTPIPTATSAPTSIPEPANTPTVAPTPISSAPALEILSHQSYVDGSWFHIVGEVQNNTDSPMEYVKIVATLYDEAGKVSGTDYGYTVLDAVLPGERSPFETGTDEWEGTTSYKLQVEGRAGDWPRTDLKIPSHEHYIDGSWLHIRGEVQNDGTTPAEYVKLVVTLYDEAGNVVGTDYGYTVLDIIPAKGTSPFDTGTDHWPGFASYDIQVEGR